MKNYKNILLAGVAGLALVAATSLASAQAPGGGMSNNQQHGTQSTPGRNPGMSHGNTGMSQGDMSQGGMSQGGMSQGKGQGMQAQGGGPSGAQNGMAPNNRYQAQNPGQPNQGGAAHNERGMQRNGQSTAQRAHTLHGLQGNASGQMQGANAPQGTAGTSDTNVRLSQQQRAQIHRRIIDARGAPRAGHVNFDVRVGTMIPRGRIRIMPVPQTLVRIQPRWRGYLYFVYADEIVVVNPRDMRIVAVLSA